METDTTYNGWKNYETWAVALWIDNAQHTYEYARERGRDAMEEAKVALDDDHARYGWEITEEKIRNRAARILGDALKEEHEEASPCGHRADIYADLMQAALDSVDWVEIAEHYLPEESEVEASS